MEPRIQKLIIVLVWIWWALPTLVQAQYTYANNSDGTCTITGYTGSDKDIVIPGTIDGLMVTSIGDDAFAFNTGLTNVVIPNSVTSIGDNAFDHCTSLANVTIPDGVTTIENYAFSVCTNLINVSIPNSVTNIGQDAFASCSSLTNLIIPNGVINIGVGAFYHCTHLVSVTIGKSVTSVGGQAFFMCTNLKSAYFLGNAPPDNGSAFIGDPTVVYYLYGAIGWNSYFGGVPVVMENPQAIKVGFFGGNFGFKLAGTPKAIFVVEACTNLANPVWLPVATNTFIGIGTNTFIDLQWINCSVRFYRFRSP